MPDIAIAPIRVTAVTPAASPITKGVSGWGRPEFRLPVTYTLEDGRSLVHHIAAAKKKDLPRGLAAAQRCAAGGGMDVENYDPIAGTFCVRSRWKTNFVAGGRGLVPNPER